MRVAGRATREKSVVRRSFSGAAYGEGAERGRLGLRKGKTEERREKA